MTPAESPDDRLRRQRFSVERVTPEKIRASLLALAHGKTPCLTRAAIANYLVPPTPEIPKRRRAKRRVKDDSVAWCERLYRLKDPRT